MEIEKKIFNKIYKKILNHKKKGFIIIDGITCSGKTSFSNFLRSSLKKKKIKSIIISKDLFLKSRKHRIKLLKTKLNLKINQNSNHYDLSRFKNLLFKINDKQKLTQNLNIKNLYNRKTGLNDATFKLITKPDTLYIIEGLYILEDLPKNYKPILKILLINDLYKSLSKKLERIRDKSISLEKVIYEFKKIHLETFLKYLKKNYNFNLIINYLNHKKNEKKTIASHSAIIKNFLKKH